MHQTVQFVHVCFLKMYFGVIDMKIKFIENIFYRFTVSEREIEAYIQSVYDEYGKENVLWQNIICGPRIDECIICHTINVEKSKDKNLLQM